MKTRISFIGAAIVAVLNCTSANAQVLGGSVGGAIGGTLSGGMRDMGVLTRGDAAGSLGGGLEADSLHRTTRGVAGETTHSARNASGAVRNRAESTVATRHDASANVATSAAAAASQSVDTRQIDSAASVAGSAASQLNGSATGLSSATEGAASHDTVIHPVPLPADDDVDTSALQSTSGNGEIAPKLDREPLSLAGDASGSASGEASASRKGASAQTAADGSASASVKANQ